MELLTFNNALILLVGILIGSIISGVFFIIKNRSNPYDNKALSHILDYLSDKSYSLKNFDYKICSSKTSKLIESIRFKLIHRFDSEKKIIALANLTLGKISQGNFEDVIHQECKYPLYQSIIDESNNMTESLRSIISTIDNKISALDSSFIQEYSDDNLNLEETISKKIDALSKATISYIGKMTSEDVEGGQSVLNNNMDTIDVMAGVMKDINNNISVIQEISFQIEILALNASVEAASAGEHGKGFAVVADELRLLVVNTSNASKSISELVSSAVKTSKLAQNNIGQASDSFSHIIEKILKTKIL